MKITPLSITLLDVMPKVSRQIEVPDDLPLDRLHLVLQAAFGWNNSHLYQFCAGAPYQWEATRWVAPDFMDGPEDKPADKTTLSKALTTVGEEGLTYLYDFGDDWEHMIEAGPVQEPQADTQYPRLVSAAGTCPPDDIGGAPGYQMFCEAMADKKHPEHKEMKAWYGGPFNPDKPDEDALRQSVAQLASRWSGKKPGR